MTFTFACKCDVFQQSTSYIMISLYCDDLTQKEERKDEISNPDSYSMHLTCTSLLTNGEHCAKYPDKQRNLF